MLTGLIIYCVFSYLIMIGAGLNQMYGENNRSVTVYLIVLIAPVSFPVYIGYKLDNF